jgi:hypothetical protein
MAERLQVLNQAETFFNAVAAGGLLDRIGQVGGQVDYILFVLMRYWVPTVLPPAGRERVTKNDADYWLESEQILKFAAVRLRELKPLIELLTTPNPVSEGLAPPSVAAPMAELELSSIVEGIERRFVHAVDVAVANLHRFESRPGEAPVSWDAVGVSLLGALHHVLGLAMTPAVRDAWAAAYAAVAASMRAASSAERSSKAA